MPFPASLKDLAAAHAMTDYAALAEEAMRAHRWEAALGLTEHLDPVAVLQLLSRTTRPLRGTDRLDAAWFDQPSEWGALPRFLDAWVVGLLESGVDPLTPLHGLVPRSGQDTRSATWSGTVHAMALLTGLPKTWDWLAKQGPSLSAWETLPLQVDHVSTTLLHLAIRANRWPAAQRLIQGGFSPHAPDSTGALPWENMAPQPLATQIKRLDALGLWPRTTGELQAGWDRRGLAAGLSQAWDLSLRTRMSQHLPDGDEFQRTTLIENLLRLRRTSSYTFNDLVVPTDSMDAWTATRPEDRHHPQVLSGGHFPGTWSLAQAALYVASLSGLKAFGLQRPVGAALHTGTGGTTMSREYHPLHLEPWSTIVHAMDDAALDQPLITKVVAGRKVALTARGMWALAHMEWALRPSKRPMTTERVPLEELGFPPVTDAWVREALTALTVFCALRPGCRLEELDDLFALAHGFRTETSVLPPESQVWFRTVTEAADPVLTLATAHQLEVEPGLLLAAMRTTLPVPSRPLTPQEHRRLPNFWPILTDPEAYTKAPKSWKPPILKATGAATRGMLDTLVAWGQVPTAEQVEQAVPLITRHLGQSTGEQVLAEWRAHQVQAPRLSPRAKSRLRS